MNCVKGDLAIVVRGEEHTDKIVLCVKYLGCVPHGEVDDFWEIDRRLGPIHTGTISDRLLRPIRPSEGKDITLTWKDVPTKETA